MFLPENILCLLLENILRLLNEYVEADVWGVHALGEVKRNISHLFYEHVETNVWGVHAFISLKKLRDPIP